MDRPHPLLQDLIVNQGPPCAQSLDEEDVQSGDGGGRHQAGHVLDCFGEEEFAKVLPIQIHGAVTVLLGGEVE